MARPPVPPLHLSKKERSPLGVIAASISCPHRAREGSQRPVDGRRRRCELDHRRGSGCLTVDESPMAESLRASRVDWVGEVHEGCGRKTGCRPRTNRPDDQRHAAHDGAWCHPIDRIARWPITAGSHTTVQREWQARRTRISPWSRRLERSGIRGQ